MCQIAALTWTLYFCTGVSVRRGNWCEDNSFWHLETHSHAHTLTHKTQGCPVPEGLQGPAACVIRRSGQSSSCSVQPDPGQWLCPLNMPNTGVKQWGKQTWLGRGWYIDYIYTNTWSTTLGGHIHCLSNAGAECIMALGSPEERKHLILPQSALHIYIRVRVRFKKVKSHFHNPSVVHGNCKKRTPT